MKPSSRTTDEMLQWTLIAPPSNKTYAKSTHFTIKTATLLKMLRVLKNSRDLPIPHEWKWKIWLCTWFDLVTDKPVDPHVDNEAYPIRYNPKDRTFTFGWKWMELQGKFRKEILQYLS